MNYHGRESITTNDFRHHCSPINSDIQTVPVPPKSELKDKTSSSVPNSTDGLIFVKRRALDGPFLDKNTGFRRALFGQKYGL